MRRRHLIAGLALAGLLSQPLVAAAQSPSLTVANPWSRPAVAGGTAAGFMTVTNRGKTADALMAVESPVAAKAELHRSSMEGGIMRMARIDRLAIAPGASVAFAPGGLHVMLIGLKTGLKVGDKAPAVLVFASGARVKTAFVVGLAAPVDHGHMGH